MADANTAVWEEVKLNVLAPYEAAVAVNPGLDFVLAVTESFTELPLQGQSRVNPRYLLGWVAKTFFPDKEFDSEVSQVLLLPLGALFNV